MGKFITNKGNDTLSFYVKDYAKHSSALDFLVGYFYFTGFCEIAEGIEDTPMRILIGMEAEVNANNFIREYTQSATGTCCAERTSLDKVAKKYFDTLRAIINRADALDNEDFNRAFALFTHKLEAGTLEVRKTREANHAKMYLFKKGEGAPFAYEGAAVIGSSNFSVEGFKRRGEVNVQLLDQHDYPDGLSIFEELWRTAVPLVNASNKDAFIESVLDKTWVRALPSPYLLYVRVLYEYFYVSDSVIKTPWQLTRGSGNEYADISYQTDAIREGLETLRRHSGVIVADVVGLGKSVIASCIAANALRRVAVVCPPHLMGQWDDYILSFRLNGKVYSSGKMEDALEDWKESEAITVIVDEAHRYKNEDTESYAMLHKLCAGNYVILLTATPFNNRPSDVFSMVKLFQIPGRSTIQTVSNLGEAMAQLNREYNELQTKTRKKEYKEAEAKEHSDKIAKKMRTVLDPVVIRRTRVDLQKIVKYKEDLKAQGIKFSIINPPETKTYNLGDLSSLYMDTLKKLKSEDDSEEKDGKDKGEEGFIGARYMPLAYLKQKGGQIDKRLIAKYSKRFNVDNFVIGQRNMASFMRQLLVRRFESAKYSFIRTLESILSSMQLTRKYFVEMGIIPVDKKRRYPDLDELEADMGDDSEAVTSEIERVFEEKDIWTIDADDIEPSFLKDLDKDIALIEGFIKKWKDAKSDPKREGMIDTIKDAVANDPKRKIIVFSEFSDTVDDLTRALDAAGVRVMSYTSKKASKASQLQVRENFDAGMKAAEQKDDYDVLVATDAISEGFSLHRAGAIYNYDIPYNPTRVIQRVGRINRMNKKVFDTLFIYNFFPSDIGEKVSHTKEISTLKIKLFQAIFGNDTKILTDEEVIAPYMTGEETVEDSWDAEYRNELYRIEREEKETLRQAIALPYRCRVGKVIALPTAGAQRSAIGEPPLMADSAKQPNDGELFAEGGNKGVILFSRRADAVKFCRAYPDGSSKIIEAEDALAIFKADKNEVSHPVTDAFYPLYDRAKKTSGISDAKIEDTPAMKKAMTALNALPKEPLSEEAAQYINELLKALKKDSLPEYSVKRIAAICKEYYKDAKAQAAHLMGEVTSGYVETLVQKEQRVGNEPQTILAAEELL